MMKKIGTYAAPAIEQIEIAVEQGFAGSIGDASFGDWGSAGFTDGSQENDLGEF